MNKKRSILIFSAIAIVALGCVAVVAAVKVFQAEEGANVTHSSGLLFDEDLSPNLDEDLEEDDLPPIPEVNRTTEDVEIDGVQNVTYGRVSQNLQFYRNDAYDCGLSGKYSFMVANPLNGDAEDEAPLWVYLHGGGTGYFDDDGNYFAVHRQTEDTWNHEETFDDLIRTITVRVLDRDKTLEDNTLTRRMREGYRMLVVSMCDHDTYVGIGTPYPNNPVNPDAEVNGLQATMAAIDYTVNNYPTTHVFVHGSSAGSIGAYAVGMSYASEGIALTGVVSDLIPALRLPLIIDTYKDEPDFPMQPGYSSEAFAEKAGPWADSSNRLHPEERFDAGFNMTPYLIIGGMGDPLCGGIHPAIPEAVADGFDSNCAWVAEPLELVAARPDNSLRLENFDNEGHVPTMDPGIANDVVDDFLNEVLEQNPEFPFEG